MYKKKGKAGNKRERREKIERNKRKAQDRIKKQKVNASYSELLSELPENNATFYSQIKNKLQNKSNSEICVGINCCAVCGNEESKVVCPYCRMIEYCSEEHLTRDFEPHQNVCGLLSIINKQEAQAEKINIKIKELITKYYSEEVQTHIEKQTKLKKKFPKGWEKFLALLPPSFHIDFFEEFHGREFSQLLSYPLTLAYSLYLYQFEIRGGWKSIWPSPNIQINNNNNSGKERIAIHVIGASSYSECVNVEIWKEFILSLKRVDAFSSTSLSFSIFFIGIEISDDLHRTFQTLQVNGNEDSDQNTLELFFWKSDYKQSNIDEAIAYFNNNNNNIKDNNNNNFNYLNEALLVVGYHMGLNVEEYDWETSLKLILSKSKPLLLTSYTLEEARRDRKHLLDLGFNCSIEANFVNPFASNKYKQSGTMANDIYNSNRYFGIYKPCQLINNNQK